MKQQSVNHIEAVVCVREKHNKATFCLSDHPTNKKLTVEIAAEDLSLILILVLSDGASVQILPVW